MKKRILLALLGLLVLGLVGLVWQGIQNDTPDTDYVKTFTLPATNINTLHVAGLEQPAKVVVTETDSPETSVHITGQIAHSNITNMEEQFGIDEEGDLQINFAKDGLTMTVMGDKPTVTIEIALAQGVTFKDFYLFTSNGRTDITLPASFDGQFRISSKNGRTIQPENGINSKRQAKVESTGGDVTVNLK